MSAISDWLEAYERAKEKGTVSLRRDAIGHPREVGARPTATVATGQIADFVVQMRGSRDPLYVREFEDRYQAISAGEHLARVAVTAACQNNPQAIGLAGGALLGAVLGTAVSPKAGASVVGAGLGVLLAAALLSKDE